MDRFLTDKEEWAIGLGLWEELDAEKERQRMRNDSEYYTSLEFRGEVMAALMFRGATYEQAFNRTRDQKRIDDEARKLRLK